jgi:hypothetical protein
MKMGATRILLTHFSNQYVHSLPAFEPNARTVWATDLMSVQLCQLRQLPLVVPPMTTFFNEHLAVVLSSGTNGDDDEDEEDQGEMDHNEGLDETNGVGAP